MPDVRAIAAAYGVRVEIGDLGDWKTVSLVAEYDPDGPVIRVNERALWRILRQAQDDRRQAQDDNRQAGERRRRTIDHAIAHELYHHREAIGEVRRIREHAARERAADAYADVLVCTVMSRASSI